MARVYFFFCCFALLLTSCESDEYKFAVHAKTSDLLFNVVSFELLPPFTETQLPLKLTNLGTGKTVPVQRIDDIHASFILDEAIPKHESREFLLTFDRQGIPDEITNNFPDSLSVVNIKVNSSVFFEYQVQTQCPGGDLPKYYCRSGFIHPLRAPDGTIITDDFPVGHTHQHALFFAWTRTKFKTDTIDFWNQQLETGTVRHKTLKETYSGPLWSGFKTVLDHVSLKQNQVILEENWDVKAFPFGKYNAIDLVGQQKNISEDTFFLLKYHYGGLGLRGSKFWNQVDSMHFKTEAQFLTSEGITSRIDGNHTRPVWTAMYGEIDGKIAGLAVFDHPENIRHPQPIRIHPDMPYFCLTPVVESEYSIPPGQVLNYKYRIVTFNGAPDKTELDAIWKAYTAPIKITE